MNHTPEWQALLHAPRHRNALLTRSEIPAKPGVYAWFMEGDCMYVGKANDLRDRLNSHRRTSPDLSRSTLRASVAVWLLGVTRKHARSRPSVMTPEQIQAVNAWFAQAELAWMECENTEHAAGLEARLRASWMPPLNIA